VTDPKPEYLNIRQIVERYGQRAAYASVLFKARERGKFPDPDVRIGVLTRNPVHGWKTDRVDRWIGEELSAAGVDGAAQLAERHLRFIEPQPWWHTRLAVLVGAADVIAACPEVEPQRIRRALATAGDADAQFYGIQVGNRTGWHPADMHVIIARAGWPLDDEVANRISRTIAQL
jgi:hypothetical protein